MLSVSLTVTGSDAGGVERMRFSNDGITWTTWLAYSTAAVQWQIAGAVGSNAVVYVKLRDKNGNVSNPFSATISIVASPLKCPAEAVIANFDDAQTWWGVDTYRWHDGVWTFSRPPQQLWMLEPSLLVQNKPSLTELNFFAHFSFGYMPPDLNFKISPDTGSDPDQMEIVLEGNHNYSLTKNSSGGFWSGKITGSQYDPLLRWLIDNRPSREKREMSAQIRLTKGSDILVCPLPPVVMDRTDPSGTVTNSVTGEEVTGAKVTLYYFNSGSGAFEFADPNFVGIDPLENPLYTDATGHYGWNVEEGRYYIKVEAPWYDTITQSRIVTIPPPVTDLHIPMTSIDVTPPNGSVVISEGQYTESPVVNLIITSSDTESQVKGMRLSQRADFAGAVWEALISSQTTKQFTIQAAKSSGKQFKLAAENGLKTVYVQFKDVNGNISTVTVNAALVSSTLDGAHPYPNPFKPNSGLNHQQITFTGLTAGKVRLRIFNLAGEMIYDAEQATSGTLDWPAKNMSGGKVASGVYIYYLTDPGTGGKKKGKLAIIR